MEKSYYQKQIFSFSRWTRKAFAAFQSLELQIKISSLSIALLVVSFVQTGFAQVEVPNEASKEFDLDTLEVMGEMTPELATELARQVQLVKAAELESSSIRCLQDAVNSMSQIDLRQRGKNDVQADLSLRGSTFDQVQVLLNGFDLTDPQTGHHSLNLPIAFSQINHLEVLSGPGSRALGPNAYAGAVNFVTTKPKSNAVDIDLSVGDFALMDFSAGLSLKTKQLGHYFSVNYSSSDGYAENTDYEKASVYYYGEYLREKTELTWQGAVSNRSFGANSFYTPRFPDQYEQIRTAFGALSFKTKGKVSTQTQLHYRGNVDRFELFREGEVEPAWWYKNHNYHFSQVFQFSSKAWFWSKFGKTNAGINFRKEAIQSNVLGLQTGDTVQARFDSEGFYTKADERQYATISLEQVYRYKRFKIAGGLMYYHFLDEETENGIFPGIDMSYDLSKKWKVYGGVNTGMRLPTFTDLYYVGPSNIGNPDLVAESQVSYELGFTGNYGFVSMDVRAFLSEAENSIDWVRSSDTLQWQPINVTDVTTQGFDIGFAVYPSRSKADAWKWINTISFKYTYLDKVSSTPDEYHSHYVMDYLKNKVVFGLNHKIYKGLSMDYFLHYHDREGQYLLYDAESKKDAPTDYEAYTLLDLRLSWRHKGWQFYLDMSNALDIEYQDYGNVVQPGRWFSVGAKKRFDF